MEDDNKLVGLSDLEKEDPIVTKWDIDVELMNRLKSDMEKLTNLRFNTIPDKIIEQAMNVIIADTKWYDYESFKTSINNIFNSAVPVSFSLKAQDKKTGKYDFWMLKTFVNVNKDPTFVCDEIEYNKKEVFLSKQFTNKLRWYCKNILRDEVQFWVYTNSMHGSGQKIDLNKLSQNDKIILNIQGKSNPDDLILFQFKKKSPEVFVGCVSSSNTV